MKCPLCSVPLIVVERMEVELDYCIACKGFWFDSDELDILTQALQLTAELPEISSLPEADSNEKPRRCPRCSKKMEKVDLSKSPKILVDRCPKSHGLWFDSGELGEFLDQQAISYSGDERPILSFLGEVFSPKIRKGSE